MATLIPCSVDTAPMAAELQSVSNHVKGTTAAVVTMQTAVIAAENKGANKVCSNVNRGFFTLMRSQISQKIANKQSRVEALIMQLGQQKRQLLSIKTNMEREYGRIAERYLRIFTSVNKELESRIRQIDQPVFELVNKHMMTSSNRMNALSGWVTTSQAEGITQSQQILVSKMKHNAQVALEQSTEFLSQIGEQRVLTGKVLISNPMGNESKTYQIPVVIWETLNDNSGIPRTEVNTPEALAKIHSDQINNVIRESETLPWGEDQSSMVAEEFMSIVDSSASTPRVKDMIKKMFASSDYKTV
ncbi:hypothetical protein [Prevotella pectinovora]|uniref:hypothetical protein n=1 Tax=Prevotella pectinovora TaxID=1602169 RepID=UPI0005B6CF34|nr:hypothetical protein [Prevotella pectinovora]KIP56064.1 hypothetical protein ST41_08550 [Prevotella pectinovora]